MKELCLDETTRAEIGEKYEYKKKSGFINEDNISSDAFSCICNHKSYRNIKFYSGRNCNTDILYDSFGGVRAILQVVMYPFIYLTGKGVYFILCNERKSRINGGCNEEESKGIDEDLKEDEHGIGKVSSEIILIPGIDEDMEEGKNGSVSAGNSGDC